MSIYTAEWDKRLKIEKERRCRRAQEAAIIARGCAFLLCEKYGARKVYLIGSLKEPEAFYDGSDIDLVVEGLPPRLYFKALAELWRQLPAGLELDLIPLEDADPELRSRTLKEGVMLYG